jgi:NADH-quinone oxidoreductase subunit L
VFFAFHGKERFESHGHEAHAAKSAEEPHHEEMHGKPHETPWVVTLPLILLAIPSIFIGAMTIQPMLYGGWFEGAIAPTETMEEMAREFHGWGAMTLHALGTVPFWFAIAGVATAYFLYIVRPDLPAVIKQKAGWLATLLDHKYYFDEFNDWFFAGGARRLGTGLWSWGDKTFIDGVMVNGTAHLVGWFASVARRIQTGYIYHYAFTMIFGVFFFVSFLFYYTFLK